MRGRGGDWRASHKSGGENKFLILIEAAYIHTDEKKQKKKKEKRETGLFMRKDGACVWLKCICNILLMFTLSGDLTPDKSKIQPLTSLP